MIVWAGIIDTNIIGPYFFDANVSADTYSEMLTDYLLPELARLGYDSTEICYMHDGAPAHKAAIVRQCLLDNFRCYIGPRHEDAFLCWPPRSPDLNPLDFFLWGYVKHIVFQSEVENMNDVEDCVREALDTITVEMLQNVQAGFIRRLNLCMLRNGDLFEHFR